MPPQSAIWRLPKNKDQAQVKETAQATQEVREKMRDNNLYLFTHHSVERISPISSPISSSSNRYGRTGPNVAIVCPIWTTLTMAYQTSDQTSLYLGDSIDSNNISNISIIIRINSSTINTIITIGMSRKTRAM